MRNTNNPPHSMWKVFVVFKNSVTIWFLGTVFSFLIWHKSSVKGVRHFTGYFVGIINLSFRRFAIIVYSGALFWVSFFLIGGYLLGGKSHYIFNRMGQHIGKIVVGVIVIASIMLGIRFREKSKRLFKQNTI